MYRKITKKICFLQQYLGDKSVLKQDFFIRKGDCSS